MTDLNASDDDEEEETILYSQHNCDVSAAAATDALNLLADVAVPVPLPVVTGPPAS